jgi:uracil-DNA glycosylase family 4
LPALTLTALNKIIVDCRLCPRLVAHREAIGEIGRRAYRGQSYWSRPVPGFGDPNAELVIIGLAPGAHGANRTGRMFTGDRSGDFLFRALFESGFANQPVSVNAQDGLELRNAYITAPVHCVPPDNKPTREEMQTCRSYLAQEIAAIPHIRAIVALGRIALDNYLALLQNSGLIAARSPFQFAHGAVLRPVPDGPLVIASYHPSQQNTSTGKLTAAMLAEIFAKTRHFLETGNIDC